MIKEIKRITLSIESQYQNVPLVSAAVQKLSSSIPLGHMDTYATELCVTEAVVNRTRPEGPGFKGDHIGFGTILFAREGDSGGVCEY